MSQPSEQFDQSKQSERYQPEVSQMRRLTEKDWTSLKQITLESLNQAVINADSKLKQLLQSRVR